MQSHSCYTQRPFQASLRFAREVHPIDVIRLAMSSLLASDRQQETHSLPTGSSDQLAFADRQRTLCQVAPNVTNAECRKKPALALHRFGLCIHIINSDEGREASHKDNILAFTLKLKMVLC